ncbi:MAG: hypothetical protein NTV70_21755 [Acidobacteria bacterium]|nr:hypothetical protein [Acidobacteriota bacterium]
MRNFRIAAACALVSLSALTACGPSLQNKEAVQAGVLAHLKTRSDLNISSMDVEVTNVSFRKGEADATVIFKAKGTSDPGGSMSIAYTLEQKGNEWVVKGRRSSAGDGHGATAPGMAPPSDGVHGGGAAGAPPKDGFHGATPPSGEKK